MTINILSSQLKSMAIETYTPNSSRSTEPVELIPTIAYGDERAHDAGNDRAIANALNNYHDFKSAHQGAFLWNVASNAGLSGSSNNIWNPLFCGILFLGTEHLGASITRTLTLAPIWRSYDGNNAWLRIAISVVQPQSGPSKTDGNVPGGFSPGPYVDPMFTGASAITAEYGPITGTSWQIGADSTLNITKNLQFGYVWLIVEGAGSAQSCGLSKCIEGPRVVVT